MPHPAELAPRLIAAEEVIRLAERGALPTIPERIENLNAARRRRPPTEAEFASYQWFVVGDPPTGLMALRITYDLHANADVISVDHLTGPLPAVRALIALVGRMCHETGMDAIGSVDAANTAMHRILTGAGFPCERLTFVGTGHP